MRRTTAARGVAELLDRGGGADASGAPGSLIRSAARDRAVRQTIRPAPVQGGAEGVPASTDSVVNPAAARRNGQVRSRISEAAR